MEAETQDTGGRKVQTAPKSLEEPPCGCVAYFLHQHLCGMSKVQVLETSRGERSLALFATLRSCPINVRLTHADPR